jgi:hypothetical protein
MGVPPVIIHFSWKFHCKPSSRKPPYRPYINAMPLGFAGLGALDMLPADAGADASSEPSNLEEQWRVPRVSKANFWLALADSKFFFQARKELGDLW